MSNYGHQALPKHRLASNQLLNLVPGRILYFQVQGGKYDSHSMKPRSCHNSNIGGVGIYHNKVHLHDLCLCLNR